MKSFITLAFAFFLVTINLVCALPLSEDTTVMVIDPAEGVTVNPGSSLFISWIVQNPPTEGTVDVIIYHSGTEHTIDVVRELDLSITSYTGTIPAIAEAGTYYVTVTVTGTQIVGTSTDFTIT
ncbi:5382_t:CDS:2 [Acaulospora colombiana]|uniref:5382_t:CDS:1 n=1 Tax=Acaulospora colombiana TaxID=27376 RepID=A0ACA9KBB3_9GLOM|nr:5382_t:CDS:2 [Acaulospora colombiana]